MGQVRFQGSDGVRDVQDTAQYSGGLPLDENARLAYIRPMGYQCVIGKGNPLGEPAKGATTQYYDTCCSTTSVVPYIESNIE